MIRATRNVPNPRSPMAVTTIATSPAAGPETLNDESPISQTMIPPIIPATSPLMRGAPLAIAIPRQSGMATKKTAIPAGKSYFRFFNILS